MAELRRGSQTLQQQWREMHIFALLGAIRIAMLWFSEALEGLKRELGIGLSQISAHLGVVMRTPLLVVYALILFLLYGQLLRGKRIAPQVLDALGVWVMVSLFIHFAKINLLMLTNAVNPKLLLGQVITYLLFFVLAWGWIFWRLDRVAGPADQQIVSLPVDASSVGGSFDYYYSSLMSILEGKASQFNGVSRLGKILVAVHSLMVLDLAAIALARFYQLVQKSI
ncbi:MAG: hypothetical protein VKN56_07335 [Cyanobacteriota bacterium]|nr:hypothetical protein [Cyanobacteriota bacterium]